jgi:O-antigen/teichoic acid export membrane protein
MLRAPRLDLTMMHRRPFVRNVAVVLTGAAMSQAIGIAISPIVSRLFSPEAFGVLGSFMSVLGLIGPLVTLTYAGAIVIPQHEEESAAIVWLSMIISAGMAIASVLAIAVYSFCSTQAGRTDVRGLLCLVPIVIVFEALLQVSQQCMIRERRYRETAQFNILQAIVTAAAKVAAGFRSPTAFALVLVSLLAVPINAGFYAAALNINRSDGWWPPRIQLDDIKAAARRYVHFPLYRAPQSLVSAFSLSMPLLVLAYFHGTAAAGFFTLSNTVLGAPTQLMTKAINDVFFPRLVDGAHRREDVTVLVLKAAGALGAVSIVPMLVLILAGPELFRLVFGVRWSEAGEYSRWLSLLTCTTLVLRAALTATPILNLQGTYLIFEIASTALKLASLSIAMFGSFSPLVAVASYSIAGSVSNVLFFWYIIVRSTQLRGSY